MKTRGLAGALLVASLAFNLGVGVMFGMRSYNGYVDRAQQPPERRGWRRERGDPYAALQLTEEQRQDFEAAKRQLIEDQSELRNSLHDEFTVLAELLCDADQDPIEIDERLRIIAGLRNRMMCEMVEHFGRLRAELRPEQMPAFQSLTQRILLGAGMGPPPPRRDAPPSQ